MSEGKHTPGPWKIVYGGMPNDEGFGIASNNANSPRGIVAECWPATALREDRPRIAADAALIAAAPDLLAACESALDAIDGNYAEVGEQLRAAIAKATPRKD